MARVIEAVDMFCGAGGTSEGLRQACEEQGYKLRLRAINHWDKAIESHARNHPWAEHHCTEVDKLKPLRVVGRRTLDLLVASPECTHHSNARGGKPRDEQFRMLTVGELAAAHSFPGFYWFSGNTTDQVKQIGNSVPVRMARALALQAVAQQALSA